MIDADFGWPEILTQLLGKNDLSVSQAEWLMAAFMSGSATAAQQGAALTALNAKGVTVGELVGFRDSILGVATVPPLPSNAVDIVGTGGDRHGTVSVSTTAAFVASSAGVPVVKHGNRAASSKSGAADVLAALGVGQSVTPERWAEIFQESGLAFLHAGQLHPGFKHVAQTRKELGIPTVFNFLGPLCNPVRPEASAIGVADATKAPLIAGVFQIRGATALVFRGDDGLDELTTTGHSRIWEVVRGAVTEHDLDPLELGIPRASLQQLRGGTPEENAEVLKRTLAGESGPVRDIVLLNAAAAIAAYRLYENPSLANQPLLKRLAAAYQSAAEAVDSGAAEKQLHSWLALTSA